jgi:hypothetical protein
VTDEELDELVVALEEVFANDKQIWVNALCGQAAEVIQALRRRLSNGASRSPPKARSRRARRSTG